MYEFFYEKDNIFTKITYDIIYILLNVLEC